MAYTTLNSLLTAIAEAIRNKKGTTATINAQNFPSEIDSLNVAPQKTYALKDGVIQNEAIVEYKSGDSTITHNNGNITLELSTDRNGEAYLKIDTTKLDISKFSFFHCHFKSIRANYYYQTYMKSGVYKTQWYENLNVEVMDMALPIINTNECKIGYNNGNSKSKIEIYDMWLE